MIRRNTKILLRAVSMVVILCVIACLTPFLNRVGEQYFVIVAVMSLSCVIAIFRPVLFRSDLLLLGVFVYVLIVSVFRGSLHTPITFWRWMAAGIAFFCGRLFIKEQCLFAGVLMGPAFVQMIFVILQRMGVLQSLSFFFPVSGTFGNPAQAAVLISVGVAASLTIIKEKWAVLRHGERITFIGLALLFLIALLLCNTRSCLLASIAVTTYLVFDSRFSKKKMLLLTLLVVILAATGLYFFRTGSANVRLLIWRASWHLFENHPVFGNGTTTFAEGYMFAQAEYFTRHPGSSLMIFANDHGQPYNELIRLLCEQGVVGTMLILTLITRKVKENGRMPLYLLSLLVISFFYNVSDTFVLFLLFWIILGQMGGDIDMILRKDKQQVEGLLLGGIMAIFSFCFLVNHDYMASDKWKTSALSYHRVCNEGDALLSQGQPAEAEQRYKLAKAMIPCRITAPYKLFKLYESAEPDKAIRWGRHVLDDMTFPLVSGQTLQMKAEIRSGIDSLERFLSLSVD